MQVYLKAVQGQLRKEVNNAVVHKWLLAELKERSFILRAERAEVVCKKLGVEFTEIDYYRDIHVWLPDVEHGMEAMPPCPHCRTGNHVGAHGWRDDHYARRVVDINSTFYIMSRRYRCSTCAQRASAATEAAAMASSSSSSGMEVTTIPPPPLPRTDTVHPPTPLLLPTGRPSCGRTRPNFR